MTKHDVPARERSSGWLRTLVIALSALLLPPFLLLAVAPMLLLLAPVALIGIPFIVPAMLTGSIAAREEDRQRASASMKPVPRLRAVS